MDNSQVDVDNEIIEPGEERAYTTREKALRDYFVEQYLVDYNQENAAVRCGYPKSMAKEFSVKFMEEPYVLREIRRREGAVNLNNKEDLLVEQARIIAALKREANFFGPGSSQAARVAALGKLAQLYEMEPKNKPKDDGTNPLEGTIVTPGLMTEEQWEAEVKKQQDELVAKNAIAAANMMPPAKTLN